jgi:hypothetical protein
MPASFLICDRSCLEPLFAEGGLRRPFVYIVEADLPATVDDVAGDGKGLDDALAASRLVYLDPKLIEDALEVTGASAAGQDEKVRYARNFIPKLASAQSFWLELITSSGSDQVQAIKREGARINEVCRAVKSAQCALVLVLTEPVDNDSRQAINDLVCRDEGPIRQVYLLESGLQAAERDRRYVQASSVWPLYVARLLVACAQCSTESRARLKGVFAWRGFHVGTHDEQSVESPFRQQLREVLLPSRQSKLPEGPFPKTDRKSTGAQATSPAFEPADKWSSEASALKDVFEGALCDEWFCEQLKGQGQTRKSSASEGLGLKQLDKNHKKVEQEWHEVAKKGPEELRRMAEGEMRASWWGGSVSELHESQRRYWSRLIKKRLDLRRRRDALLGATAELVEARRHHLAFAWRLYIALALLMGIAQFYGALLEPLRQASASVTSEQRSTLFGEPVEGSRIGFLIDRSVVVGAEQFERTKQQLAKAVQALDASREFSLGAYSDDVTFMPECARGPIRAIELNKAKALVWIESLKPQGEPDPARAVEAIVQSGLDRIALVSSGTVVEGGVERLKQLVDRAGSTFPPIDTITLPSLEEVPLLRELAGATKGRFQRVAFDPFAPIGFWATLLILVGLAALGAALGVSLPWWWERRAGDRETGRLKRNCETLRREFVINGSETGVLFADAKSVCESSACHALGVQQQELAKRALAALQQVLDGSSSSEPDSVDHEGDRLRREDRIDVRRVLDVLVPNEYLPDSEESKQIVKQRADKAAEAIRKRWVDICEDVDRDCRGHLPVAQIRQLSEEVDRQIDELASRLVKLSIDGRPLQEALVAELCEKLTSPAGYPLLSVPVKLSSGETSPARLLHVRFRAAGVDAGVDNDSETIPKRVGRPASYSKADLSGQPAGLAGFELLVEQVQLQLTSESWVVK